MGSPSTEATDGLFYGRIKAGDAAVFAQLYTEAAVFTYDGQEKAIGRAPIERAISGVMLAGLKMRGRSLTTHVCGDIALTRFAWELYNAQDATMASGVSTEVQRLGADGLWRMAIDDTGGGSRAP